MYLRQLRKMMGHEISYLSHPNLHMPRITRDEADVQPIVTLLEDDWTNHFDPNESEFVSISTGTLAPPDVAGTSLMRKKNWHGSIRGIQARPA